MCVGERERNTLAGIAVDSLWVMDTFQPAKGVMRALRCKALLMVVDAFSKYAMVRVLRNQTGGEMRRVVENIFEETKRRPATILVTRARERKRIPTTAALL